jgi:hypothetical protein
MILRITASYYPLGCFAKQWPGLYTWFRQSKRVSAASCQIFTAGICRALARRFPWDGIAPYHNLCVRLFMGVPLPAAII